MTTKKYCYEYPRPAVSADCVLFGYDGNDLYVLLIERGQEPYKEKWAFPGGFLDMDETTAECAYRELKEETGIENPDLVQVGAFSEVDRDPRGRVITVAYMAVVTMSETDAVAGDDAASVEWFRLKDIPPLAFDHSLVLRTALGRLRDELIPGNGPRPLTGKLPGDEREMLTAHVSNFEIVENQPD
jgi:8-oxo-dGTP diphosphatase